MFLTEVLIGTYWKDMIFMKLENVKFPNDPAVPVMGIFHSKISHACTSQVI